MEKEIKINIGELKRIRIIEQLIKNQITIEDCIEILKLSKRQIYRLKKKYEKGGEISLIHGLKGKKSNHSYSQVTKKKIINIYRSDYSDYGPTLFSEKLLKNHNIDINHETIRIWLRENAITTSIRKKRPHRKKRERRTCFGEMLQFDGSIHDWFEGRGSKCCLFQAIDDATNKVYIKFAVSENSADAMQVMYEYVRLYGVPRSIYTDHGSVYSGEVTLTDFSRAMKELGSQLIFANSPQAKGRVERGNRTLQDRLVKALREKGISNIGEANKYLLDEFTNEYNERFELKIEAPDVHYPIEDVDLRNIFCYKTRRQVRNDYTITLNGKYIQLLKSDSPLPIPSKEVEISKWLDESLHIYYNDKELMYEILSSKPKPKQKTARKPKSDHPWKTINKNMFKPKRNKKS